MLEAIWQSLKNRQDGHVLPIFLAKEMDKGLSPFSLDNFFRPIFILPSCQSRHTTSSLGQFLFYRRVRTVTRLMLRSYPFRPCCSAIPEKSQLLSWQRNFFLHYIVCTERTNCTGNICVYLLIFNSLKRKRRDFLCWSYRKFRLFLFKKHLLYFLPGFLPELTYSRKIRPNLLSDRECHCPEMTTKP